MPKTILLINPWIYDFAAYDLWLKPWGLLKISSILKKSGFKVFLVDAMDRHHSLLKGAVKDLPNGTGKFYAEEVEKPEALKGIRRKYKRYGIPEEAFIKALPDDKVDFTMVSSGMTYWYPGAHRAIEMLKEKYPDVPVILGGIYASLCYQHAVEESGADIVIQNKDLQNLSAVLGGKTDLSHKNILNEGIDYSWYRKPPYAVLRLSLGCPFNCMYCAQKRLSPAFFLKDMDKALDEITGLSTAGIKNFAFYDDALFYDTDYIKFYLKELIKEGIGADLYTPNGLHARFIDEEIAGLMRRASFKKPVLSLETADETEEISWHDKVSSREVKRAITFLKDAGYKEGEYWVYVLLGVPGFSMEKVRRTVDFAHSLGAKVSLSEFSSVPGTKMAEALPEALDEPLLQNNSVFPSLSSLAEKQTAQEIKQYARVLNGSFK